jgi:hypothetical protein
MKNHNPLVLVFVLLLSLPACAPAQGDLGCAATLEALASLRLETGEAPPHLLVMDPVERGTEFDPNRTFEVYTRLSMQEGYLLDYIYTYDGLDGHPALYARQASLPPWLSSVDVPPNPGYFLEHIQVEDTPEGYLQYAILASTAEQFYLFGQGNYNDQQILCSRKALREIVRSLEQGETGRSISAAERDQALAIGSVEPVVTLQAETATVQLVTFTRWGGFYRLTFTIERSFPHFILDARQEQVAPYNCGISL